MLGLEPVDSPRCLNVCCVVEAVTPRTHTYGCIILIYCDAVLLSTDLPTKYLSRSCCRRPDRLELSKAEV